MIDTAPRQRRRAARALGPAWLAVLCALAILAATGQAVAVVPEICGDGIDNDASGGDALCSAPDQDRDGYYDDGTGPHTGTDCDDTDRNIYPGIWVDAGGGNVQLCQSDGTYAAAVALSAMTCNSGSGNVYWMSTTGNNANAGTYASPWRDYRGFVDSGVAGYHAPVAGDCFVFKDSGTYTGTWTSGSTRQLYLNNKDGTSSDPIRIMGAPGVTAEIVGQGSSPTSINPVAIAGSDYILLENVTIHGGWSNGGVAVSSSTGFEMRNVILRDLDGEENDNASCIRLDPASTDAYVHHSTMYDCYDTTGTDPQNHRLITVFESDGIRISDVVLYFTSTLTTTQRGPCLGQKHGLVGGSFTVERSFFYHCNHYAVGSNGPNTTISNNIVAEGEDYAFKFQDFGAPFNSFAGNVVDNNTIINTKFIDTGLTGEDGTAGNFTISDNVVTDDRTYSAGGDDALIRFDYYGPDSSFTTFVTGGKLLLSNNIYYSSATSTIRWTLWGDNDGSPGPSEPLGAVYSSLATWQGAFSGNETGSAQENPSLDSDNFPTSTNQAGKGAFRLDVSPTPTPSPTASPSPTPTPVPTGTFDIGPTLRNQIRIR